MMNRVLQNRLAKYTLALALLATIAATVAITMVGISHGQGQAVGLGVLPLRFQAAHEGAGIETNALIGDYCITAEYYTDNETFTKYDPLSPAPITHIQLTCQESDEANPPTNKLTHPVVAVGGGSGSSYVLTATEVKDVLTGDDALTSAQIKNGSLTADDLAARTLTSGTYGDGSVTGRAVQERSLPGTSLVEDTLTSAEIGPASVGPSELQNSSVTIDKLSSDLRESLGHSSRYRLYGGYVAYRHHTDHTAGFIGHAEAHGSHVSNSSQEATITVPAPGNDHLSGFWIDARYGTASGETQQATESEATRRASLGARFFPWPPATPGTTGTPTVTDFTFTAGGRSIHLQWETDGTDNPKMRPKSGATQSLFNDVDIYLNIYAEFVDAP